MAEGKYIDKQRDGQWQIYNVNGVSKGEINYKVGVLHGKSIVKYKNGAVAEDKNYVAGLVQGKHNEYFDTGKIKKETSYTDGKLDGRLLIYFDGGKIKVSGKYVKGLRHGLWVIYDGHSRILKYQMYTNGKEASEEENMKLIEGQGIKIYVPPVEPEPDIGYDGVERKLQNNEPY